MILIYNYIKFWIIWFNFNINIFKDKRVNAFNFSNAFINDHCFFRIVYSFKLMFKFDNLDAFAWVFRMLNIIIFYFLNRVIICLRRNNVVLIEITSICNCSIIIILFLFILIFWAFWRLIKLFLAWIFMRLRIVIELFVIYILSIVNCLITLYISSLILISVHFCFDRNWLLTWKILIITNSTSILNRIMRLLWLKLRLMMQWIWLKFWNIFFRLLRIIILITFFLACLYIVAAIIVIFVHLFKHFIHGNFFFFDHLISFFNFSFH